MEFVEPNAEIIVRPQIDPLVINEYLYRIGGLDWFNRVFDMPEGTRPNDSEVLIEFCGRLCYKSWAPGLNANVTRVREDSAAYLTNILDSGHGSVLEHANFSFLLTDVSRIFTHEVVRHRAGVALSQESMRYVRLTDIPFWFPEWAVKDTELLTNAIAEIERAEDFQMWMADHFGLDDENVPFSEKKAKTSFMRRFAPGGVATNMVLTANIRSIRHMMEMRTSEHAEEEIALVFRSIARKMIEEVPLLFGDYEYNEDTGAFESPFRKV
jgi:thymidylate synthase (FAD)